MTAPTDPKRLARLAKMKVCSMAEIMATVYPPPRWLVSDLILENSVTLLTAPPKIGKSFLALEIASGVCTGTRIMGEFDTVGRCPVLLVGLEDSERRLQARVRIVVASGLDLTDLHVVTALPDREPPFLLVDDYLSVNPGIKLCIIDTLARFTAWKPAGGTEQYTQETELMGKFRSLAERHGCAFLLVHHSKKGRNEEDSGDFTEAGYGSQGLFGAADGLLSITRARGQAKARLRGTFRDSGDVDLALSFDDGKWTVLGDGVEFDTTSERAEILRFVREQGQETRASEIEKRIGKSATATGNLLKRMVEEGTIRKVRHGVYNLPPTMNPPIHLQPAEVPPQVAEADRDVLGIF